MNQLCLGKKDSGFFFLILFLSPLPLLSSPSLSSLLPPSLSSPSLSLSSPSLSSLLPLPLSQLALQEVQPSAIREGFATVPDTSWDDVGALEDVREELTLAILVSHTPFFLFAVTILVCHILHQAKLTELCETFSQGRAEILHLYSLHQKFIIF